MDDKDKITNQLDETSNRHREMTDERKMKRKKILKYVAVGTVAAAGVGAGIAGCTGCNYIANLMYETYFPVVGGAMGQWEEVPMQPEAGVEKFNKLSVGMRVN